MTEDLRPAEADQERQRRVFFEIHSGNLREGPGDTASARRAWAVLAPHLPRHPHRPSVLDIGCGPGGQTQDLARFAGTNVVAVDNYLPFLRSLPRRLDPACERSGEGQPNTTSFTPPRPDGTPRGEAPGQPRDSVHPHSGPFGPGIAPVAADMKRLPFRSGSFDLLWSEGAIYIAGFDAGLEDWRPLLKTRGAIAVTEISWLRADPPADLATFWNDAYPAMRSVRANEEAVRAAGYELLDRFVLPESSWWDTYYTPIERKLPEFRRRYASDPAALQVVDSEQQEIDLYRRYAEWYGYVFYIGRRED